MRVDFLSHFCFVQSETSKEKQGHGISKRLIQGCRLYLRFFFVFFVVFFRGGALALRE